MTSVATGVNQATSFCRMGVAKKEQLKDAKDTLSMGSVKPVKNPTSLNFQGFAFP